MRFCVSQWLFIILVVLLGISSMLSACGKKGPLYIPEKPAKVSEPVTSPAGSEPASDTETPQAK